MMSSISTKERLARALEEINDPALATIVQLARAGYYDECGTALEFPISTLVDDLRELGHHDFAQRAIDGEFDASREEWKQWADRPETQAIFDQLSKEMASQQ